MKTLKVFFVCIAALLLFAAPLKAQTMTNAMAVYETTGDYTVRWNAITMDSLTSIWSQTIDVSSFNNYAWTTDYVLYGGKATTAAGNPKLVMDYWICNADPAVNANWSLGNDSLFTSNATTVFNSTTARMTAKARYIKFKLLNLATGRALTRLDLGITFFKRDL